jgi:hypothetical protein
MLRAGHSILKGFSLLKPIVAASLGLAFVFAVPAQAGDTAAPAPEGKEKIVVNGDKPKERKVCTTVVGTGTMLPKRVCRTVGDEDSDQAKAESRLNDLRQAREAQQNAQFGGHN